MDFEKRIRSVIVLPKGYKVFSEMATTVEINDEGGEFLRVSQSRSVGTQSILIDPQEWGVLKEAIDEMIKECRGEK